MKVKNYIPYGLIILIVLTVLSACDMSTPYYQNVEATARRASVQPLFYIPVLKAYFATPLPEEEKLTREDVEKLLSEKIKEALEKEKEGKYETALTEIEVWGYLSQSRTHIPLGAIVPKWAKFPEKVLVVYKVEKTEITAWEKQYEKDVLDISELANVSPSQAREIISRLRMDGYSISKEKIDVEQEVKFLWFDDGWDDKYPLTLDWKVVVEGTEENIITGYDPRGILIVRHIPEKPNGELRRVMIKAEYLDLKDEYKPKTDEETALENEIVSLKDSLERYQKEEKVEKRDIHKATWGDVALGTVKIEEFWVMSAASGVFLGNMKVRHEAGGYQPTSTQHAIFGEKKGIVLTNAHVARQSLMGEIYVTEDKEIMWVFYPAAAMVRYTQDSDLYGSPAQVLFIDYSPVYSTDYDTAILVTTEVPNYEKHKAMLGNSDNIKEGDEVIMVGNPSYMQKFLTRGVVSNTNYSFTKSLLFDRWLNEGMGREHFNWAMNSNFWFDTPIGIGGTSGSGVWAAEGTEKGKVVALHNMGMMTCVSIASAKSEKKEINTNDLSGDLKDVNKEISERLFRDYPYKEAKFIFSAKDFDKEESTFEDAMKACGHMVEIAGMNAGVPINYVKQFLQERGLNPDDFGWQGIANEYWEK